MVYHNRMNSEEKKWYDIKLRYISDYIFGIVCLYTNVYSLKMSEQVTKHAAMFGFLLIMALRLMLYIGIFTRNYFFMLSSETKLLNAVTLAQNVAT